MSNAAMTSKEAKEQEERKGVAWKHEAKRTEMVSK